MTKEVKVTIFSDGFREAEYVPKKEVVPSIILCFNYYGLILHHHSSCEKKTIYGEIDCKGLFSKENISSAEKLCEYWFPCVREKCFMFFRAPRTYDAKRCPDYSKIMNQILETEYSPENTHEMMFNCFYELGVRNHIENSADDITSLGTFESADRALIFYFDTDLYEKLKEQGATKK